MTSPPPIVSLDELKAANPNLADALQGTSLQFFEPACPNTHWEVERKPLQNDVLVLVPNQPVNRAWDLVFRVSLDHNLRGVFDRSFGAEYTVSPQTVPATLTVEVYTTDTEERKKLVEGVNAATRTANAVIPEANTAARREHEELAKSLGLERPSLGF